MVVYLKISNISKTRITEIQKPTFNQTRIYKKTFIPHNWAFSSQLVISLQCYNGFVDVSMNANLPPGRVCTVQTTCPKQKTDLVFLIDGSGSIGSYVFKNEVLRFVREFVELFEIGPDQTRVGLIQYSDQIRHEFDLNQHPTKVNINLFCSSVRKRYSSKISKRE